MTAPVEREVKLDAEPTFVLPDLDGVLEGVKPGPVDVATLDATYHDTADLRLARSGITLRYRVEGEDKGLWTLKLPEGNGVGPALSRTELEVPGEPGTIPETLSDLVQVHLRGAPKPLGLQPLRGDAGGRSAAGLLRLLPLRRRLLEARPGLRGPVPRWHLRPLRREPGSVLAGRR